jgi:RNA polymerase sigma factor (sigma-70 family)
LSPPVAATSILKKDRDEPSKPGVINSVGQEAVESFLEAGTEGGRSLSGLFESLWTPMVRLATLLVGSQAAAEDLVSDTFEHFARTAARPDHPARYLRTSVVNASRSYHRRRRIEMAHRPVGRTDTEDKPRELIDVLGRLSERQRTAIVLRYYLDLPEEEIAAVLRCRPGTVRSIVQRALVKLKEELSA